MFFSCSFQNVFQYSNIFSSPFTGSIPKLKNMVPAGKKLGTENFEQLFRIAQRYKLGNQTEKMLADKGSDLRKRAKPNTPQLPKADIASGVIWDRRDSRTSCIGWHHGYFTMGGGLASKEAFAYPTRSVQVLPTSREVSWRLWTSSTWPERVRT